MFALPLLQLLVGLTAAALGAAGGRPVRRVVPDVRGEDALSAYSRLHEAGFRVSIPGGVDVVWDGLESPPLALRTSPAPGRVVPAESVVTMTVVPCGRCPLGSPAVPIHMPRCTVPDFVGDSVEDAYAWKLGTDLYWTAHLGPPPSRCGA